MMTVVKMNSLTNAFLCFCVCTFVVYQIQEHALQKLDNYKPLPPPPPLAYPFEDLDQKHEDFTKIWITMGLCWSGNTKYHGKDKFPYHRAVIYSSQLWQKLTPAKVILQIVYSEPNVTPELREYSRHLQDDLGVLVKLVPSNETECVLKAQLVRLLAFKLDEVSMNDIVVTADVDAFIMTPQIVHPLSLSHKQIWLYRYELTLGTGYTFMMPFIGARAKTWKNILFLKDGNVTDFSVSGLIDIHREALDFKEDYTWDIDQHIVSYSILRSGLCSLPADNSLWSEVKLTPKPVDDSKTCWHGSGIYEDCNNKLWSRNMMIRYHGRNCKWWHFFPDEREPQMKAKFDEIINGQSETGYLNKIISNAKTFQKTWFGRTLV